MVLLQLIRSRQNERGAPELHPDFDWFVTEAVRLGKHVMVRHNLTVAYDGHPITGESKEYLHDFFAANRCEVVSSLPYYQEYFTDAQRGSGVFQKSIRGLNKLNSLGYGMEGSGLKLNLVYNPVGPYLPPAQAALEADYKRELKTKFDIVFNQLYTITNMPINRFKLHLDKSGQYEAYMDKLLAAFNPTAAASVMCRNLISVSWEGKLYDCDFNQMLEIEAEGKSGKAPSIFDFDFDQLMSRRIRFDDHCLGCTAGAGSSCGGATARKRVNSLSAPHGPRPAAGLGLPRPSLPPSPIRKTREGNKTFPPPCLPNGEQGRIRVGGSAASQYDAHLKIRKVQ